MLQASGSCSPRLRSARLVTLNRVTRFSAVSVLPPCPKRALWVEITSCVEQSSSEPLNEAQSSWLEATGSSTRAIIRQYVKPRFPAAEFINFSFSPAVSVKVIAFPECVQGERPAWPPCTAQPSEGLWAGRLRSCDRASGLPGQRCQSRSHLGRETEPGLRRAHLPADVGVSQLRVLAAAQQRSCFLCCEHTLLVGGSAGRGRALRGKEQRSGGWCGGAFVPLRTCGIRSDSANA